MLFFEIFERVSDPRSPYHFCKHSLMEMLIIALCAMISGAETFVDMEDYGVAKQEWLQTRLGLELPHGIPSHDTFGRLFAALCPRSFEKCFRLWTQQLHKESAGQVIAIDGKTVRRSFDCATGQGAIHLVSAWANDSRLVLAQQKVDAKSNEMTAVPLLLEMLDVRGCVVTADALNTQKNIAGTIQDKGADYVLALKKNHKQLYEDVESAFDGCRKRAGGLVKECHDCSQSREWGHGRREVRRCFVLGTTPEEWPRALQAWPGLQSVVMVERERTLLSPEGLPTGATLEPAVTRHFYLSSLPAEATRLGQAIRGHWGIENSLHWVLDVAFDEDDSRIRTDDAAQNMSTLRKLTLNLLRQDTQTKCGIKARRKIAGWNNEYLLQILAGP